MYVKASVSLLLLFSSLAFSLSAEQNRNLDGGYPVENECHYVSDTLEVHNFNHKTYTVSAGKNENMWNTEGFQLLTNTDANSKITVATVKGQNGHTFTASKACVNGKAVDGVVTRNYVTDDIQIKMTLTCSSDNTYFSRVSLLVPDFDEQTSTGFCISKPTKNRLRL